MVKSKSKEIINNYLDKIQNQTENKLSAGTIKTYIRIANKIPFNVDASEKTLIKNLKKNYENPNTLQLNLNLIIVIRELAKMNIEELKKLRESLKNKIQNKRKENLTKDNETLPDKKYLLEELDKLKGLSYVINYLFINHGVRNKDLNLKYVKQLPEEETENYIYIKGKNIILKINDYKTKKSHGSKEIIISDDRFKKEFKSQKLNYDDYILSLQDKSKINNVTTFNDKLIKLSIDKLGETKIFKIIIKDLLNNHDYSEIERLSKDRGTKLDVILKSYNLFNDYIENKDK